MLTTFQTFVSFHRSRGGHGSGSGTTQPRRRSAVLDPGAADWATQVDACARSIPLMAVMPLDALGA